MAIYDLFMEELKNKYIADSAYSLLLSCKGSYFITAGMGEDDGGNGMKHLLLRGSTDIRPKT